MKLSGFTRRPDIFQQMRAERRPVISNLFDGVLTRHIVSVYVPISREGTVRWVLAAGVRAGDFGELLAGQEPGEPLRDLDEWLATQHAAASQPGTVDDIEDAQEWARARVRGVLERKS